MSMQSCKNLRHQPMSSLVFCLLFITGFLFPSVSTSNRTLVCLEGKSACLDDLDCYAEDDICDGIPLCIDRTDEKNCTTSCRDDEWLCTADEQCLPLSYKCDGEADCSDGSDEEHCADVTCTLATDFMCASDRTCIVGSLRCDGTPHCQDDSDEKNCSSTSESSGCDTETSFDCLKDGTHCVPLSKLCNGHNDCGDGEDEKDPRCEINTSSHCSDNNGGCSHECIENEHGHHCECPDGLVLGYNRQTCDDVNECVRHACSHRCENLHGDYECSCWAGYRLTDDHHSCIADGEEPELWVTNGSSLVRHKLHSNNVTGIKHLSGPLHDFTYAYHIGKIFWIDSVKKVIYWCNNDTDSPSEILVDTLKDAPVALAYDWVHNNLYWADAGRHAKIEAITMEHKWRTVVLNASEVDHPKAMAVDPRADQGYLYWAEGGHSPEIRRAGLDGSDPQALVSFDVASVHSLSLDLVDNRLFWVDSKLNILESLGLVNYDRDILWTFVEHPKLPMGIGVFEDYVYWSDAESKSVYKMFKFRIEGEEAPQITTVLEHLVTPRTVEIYHELKQPRGDSYCGKNNGGCSHICLPSPPFKQFRCACPMATVRTQSFVPDPRNSSSCLLLDSSLSSTAVPRKIFTSATTVKARSVDIAVASSASTNAPTIFILKALFPLSTWQRLSTSVGLAKESFKVNSNNSMWLYIGVGVAVGILFLSLVNAGLDAKCILDMWKKICTLMIRCPSKNIYIHLPKESQIQELRR